MTTQQRRERQPRPMTLALLLALGCCGWPGMPPLGEVAAQQSEPTKVRSANLDKAALDRDVEDVLRRHGDGIQVSLWLGGLEGAAWFEADAAAVRPTASSVKAFYLVELFDRYRGRLDQELVAARAVLADDQHPAISHFSAETREEIRRELGGATVRRYGEVMIGKAKAPNAVYNAAANVTTAVLGGPEALTEAIGRRDPAFRRVTVRRYMLRDRTQPGDNEAPAQSLAALYQRLALGRLRGIDAETLKAIREVLRGGDDPELGTRFGKGGSLASDPLTQVRAGWWETKHGAVVYVVMTAQPAPGNQTRQEAVETLKMTADRLAAVVAAAGRAALEPQP